MTEAGATNKQSALQKLLQRWLRIPVQKLVDRFSSAPVKELVLEALTELYNASKQEAAKKVARFSFPADTGSLIIFSDQHRGARDGADDYAVCSSAYLGALDYYNQQGFTFINLGDCEELWENTLFTIIKHNQAEFAAEKKFIDRNAYFKVFGNHDLFWDNDPLSSMWLARLYGKSIPIYTAILIDAVWPDGSCMDIFCTHGHQGDRQSDGNAFSKWFVSYIWGPLQSYLEINSNSPSTNDNLKTLHNMYMYDWSAMQINTLLVTGHTHQPVFNSLTHLERLYDKLEKAEAVNDTTAIAALEAEIPVRKREYDFVNHSFRDMKPGYFNSGCCCFEDGTITGIEISGGFIRLVTWHTTDGIPRRSVGEEEKLADLLPRLQQKPV